MPEIRTFGTVGEAIDMVRRLYPATSLTDQGRHIAGRPARDAAKIAQHFSAGFNKKQVEESR